MISREDADLRTSIDRHDGPRVAYIDDVNHFIDHHDDSGAGAGPLGPHRLACHQMLRSGLRLLYETQKVALALPKAFSDGLHRILWKLLILDDEVVQVVPEIVSTGRASVAIKDAKETDLRPFNVEMLLILGLEDVEDDGHTVLVVVTNDALICVGCV